MPFARDRDNRWLESRLQHIWGTYFTDAPKGYPIEVKFGRAARYRYGSICNQGRFCQILINGLFASNEVPEYVVDATLAHELSHYVHGYGSGLKKLHAHPHRGGVIDKEMQKRGCFVLEERANAWRKEHWQDFYLRVDSVAAERVESKEQALRAAWDERMRARHGRTNEALRERLAQLAPLFKLEPPGFDIEWLYASKRRTGLSYRFRRDGVVRIHAALADAAVPAEVIDYEICYWLACESAGGSWGRVEQALKQAGVWEQSQRAIAWRRGVWPRHRTASHPSPAAA